MSFFVHKGIRFHYEIKGEGIPLIFLHGLGNDLYHAYRTIEEQEGIQIIGLSQQGHGKSGCSWETMTFDSMADDVMALADHLGLDTFFLGGISMGAAVSINAAIRYPKRLRGVILLRAAWTDGTISGEIADGFAMLEPYLSQEDGKHKYLEDPQVQAFFDAYPECLESFTAFFDVAHCVSMPRKFAVVPRLRPFGEKAQVEAVQVPALVMACRYDPVHPYEYGLWYAKTLPQAAFVEVPSKAVSVEGYIRTVNDSIRRFVLTTE